MEATMRTCFAAVALCAALTGCGGPATYKVVGAVTWKGEEVKDGQITFLPADKNVHAATAKIVNGRYEARVPPGRMIVQISAQRDLGYNTAMHQNVKDGSFIPPEYHALSKLTFDVQPNDGNTVDFHLPIKN
jgi:hypothetical protein